MIYFCIFFQHVLAAAAASRHGAARAGAAAAFFRRDEAEQGRQGFAGAEHAAGRDGQADLPAAGGVGQVHLLANGPVGRAGADAPEDFISLGLADFVDVMGQLVQELSRGDGCRRIEDDAAGDVLVEEALVDFFFYGRADGDGGHEKDARLFQIRDDLLAFQLKGGAAEDMVGRGVVVSLLEDALRRGQAQGRGAGFADDGVVCIPLSPLGGVFSHLLHVDGGYGTFVYWHDGSLSFV